MTPVTECVAHGKDRLDTDCEFCQAEVNALDANYKKKINANFQLEQGLNEAGVGIQAIGKLDLKLGMVLDLMLNPKQRLYFETEFANRIGNILLDIQQKAGQEARRQRLTQGIIGPNGMPIDPKRLG